MFDPFTCLTVINSLIANKNNLDVKTEDVTPEYRELMINAILRANQKLNDDYLRKVDDERDELTRFCMLMWPNIVMTGDHRERTEFMSTGFKSIKLIDYFKTEPAIYNQFANYFGIKENEDPIVYVSAILSLYILGGVDNVSEKVHHAFNDNVEETHPIVSRFCLNLCTYDPANFNSADFKTLREKPLIKIRENRYDVVNWNFLLEKLTTGLLFELWGNTGISNLFNNFGTFKSHVGLKYAEKLFQDVFSTIMIKAKKKDVFILSKPDNSVNSDFFYRRHDKIFLIEFKDALLVKGTTYEAVKDEIDRKLNSDDKGTGQLKKQLDKHKENLNIYDKNLSKRRKTHKLKFYPIIILTETAFTAGGVTQYLQKEFNKKIEGINYPFIVMPLVLVDFNFILTNYDSFLEDKADFIECIDYFIKENEKAKKTVANSSLDKFMKRFNAFSETVHEIMPKRAYSDLGYIGNYVTERLGLKKE